MNARWKEKISDRRGVSSIAAGVVLALVLASVFLAVTLSGSLFQRGTAEDVERDKLMRERQLELLRSGVLSENDNGFFSFWVRNDGGVDIRLEGVALQYGGTTTFENFVGSVGDNYLLPGAYRVYNYPLDFIPDGLASSFTGIALVTRRGNLFPIGGSTPTEYTWITGQIVDNETGEGLSGGVGGEAHSDPISFTAVADDKGHFRFLLPKSIDPGTHGYVLTITRPGYDNVTVTGSVKKGYIAFEKIKVNYNPFDLSLFPAIGSLTRGWISSTTSTYEYDMNGTAQTDLTQVRLMGGHPINTNRVTTNPNYYARVWNNAQDLGSMTTSFGQLYFGGDYDYNTGAWVSVNDYSGHTFTASNGLGMFSTSYCAGFHDVSYTPNYVYGDAHWVTEQAGYQTIGGWAVMATPDPYYLMFWGSSSPGVTILQQNFSISYNDYQTLSGGTYGSYYNDVGLFYRNDTTSYPTLASWENTQTTVTAIPLNGYTGSANLVVVPDNALLSAVPAQSKLTFASPATTTIMVTPGTNLSSSAHAVAVFAYNSDNRRLVVGSSSKPALIYNLGLTTLLQPSPSYNKVLLRGTDFYISVGPSSGSVVQGGPPAGATVSVSQAGGTGSTVTLAVVSGIPAGSGITASFGPSSGTPSFDSTLTISTTSSTPVGTYTITIRGTGEGTSHDCTYTLTVTAAQNYSVSVSPNSIQVVVYTSFSPDGGYSHWINSSETATVTVSNPTYNTIPVGSTLVTLSSNNSNWSFIFSLNSGSGNSITVSPQPDSYISATVTSISGPIRDIPPGSHYYVPVTITAQNSDSTASTSLTINIFRYNP